jgi:hypothetical protein
LNEELVHLLQLQSCLSQSSHIGRWSWDVVGGAEEAIKANQAAENHPPVCGIKSAPLGDVVGD